MYSLFSVLTYYFRLDKDGRCISRGGIKTFVLCAVPKSLEMVTKFIHVLGTCQELLTTYLT